ncbi:MAG: suppressor of hpr1 [Icmadophila ericetorum]|nr:suppressor of hpr1 [Icmadophila ericetorum]
MSSDLRPPPPPSSEPLYAGHTRFTLELEFVSLLSSPAYLSHLASQKYLSSPPFVAYLSYLQYWSTPPYIQYLSYPGPTLRALEMLQREDFRKDVLRPEVVGRWGEELYRAYSKEGES